MKMSHNGLPQKEGTGWSIHLFLLLLLLFVLTSEDVVNLNGNFALVLIIMLDLQSVSTAFRGGNRLIWMLESLSICPNHIDTLLSVVTWSLSSCFVEYDYGQLQAWVLDQ